MQFLWTQSDLQYFSHCLPVSVCLTLYLALPAATPILSPTYSILFKWPLSPNNESLSGEFLNFLAAYRVILTTTFILKFEFLFVKYLTNAPAQLCFNGDNLLWLKFLSKNEDKWGKNFHVCRICLNCRYPFY